MGGVAFGPEAKGDLVADGREDGSGDPQAAIGVRAAIKGEGGAVDGVRGKARGAGEGGIVLSAAAAGGLVGIDDVIERVVGEEAVLADLKSPDVTAGDAASGLGGIDTPVVLPWGERSGSEGGAGDEALVGRVTGGGIAQGGVTTRKVESLSTGNGAAGPLEGGGGVRGARAVERERIAGGEAILGEVGDFRLAEGAADDAGVIDHAFEGTGTAMSRATDVIAIELTGLVSAGGDTFLEAISGIEVEGGIGGGDDEGDKSPGLIRDDEATIISPVTGVPVVAELIVRAEVEAVGLVSTLLENEAGEVVLISIAVDHGGVSDGVALALPCFGNGGDRGVAIAIDVEDAVLDEGIALKAAISEEG